MKLSNFTYLVRQGARNVLSNKLMSFACIGVLVACLLLIGGAALFSLNVNSMVRYVEQQNQVVAFLSDDIQENEAQAMGEAFLALDNVLEVSYVSKEDALENQRREMAEFADLLDGLEDDNPLPRSYIIRIDDSAILTKTVDELRGIAGVNKVNAATDVAKILTGLKRGVSIAGTGIVLILVAVSVVIITNTIKLTVFSRRKEINIMKYVGATDTFIRLPFLVEGMFIGLLAACLAFLLLGFGYTYLLKWIGENYAAQLAVVYNNTIDFWDIASYLFASFAGLGIFIGAVGSGLFVRKYLKV